MCSHMPILYYFTLFCAVVSSICQPVSACFHVTEINTQSSHLLSDIMLSSGRGAAIQRILASMQEEQRENSDGDTENPLPVRPVGRGRSQTFYESELECGMNGLAIDRPSGRGRGLQESVTVPSTGRSVGNFGKTVVESRVRPSTDQATEPPRAIGRGRSALFAAFLLQQSSEQPAPGELSRPKLPKTDTRSVGHQKAVTFSPEKSVTGPVVRRGKNGQRQEIACNYIHLDVEPGKGVFEYSVEFSPDEDSISMRTRMINNQLDNLGGVKSYNGTRLLLSIELKKVTSFSCKHPSDDSSVTMTLTCRGRAREKDAADIYNMLFRRIMSHLGLKNMGRKFFDPSGAMTIPQHRLEVWPGYVTAVQEFEGGIKLCCDASHRVMRTESVLEIMTVITRANGQRFKEEILKHILGNVVLTRYNNRVYRVDDVAWDKTPNSTFTDTSGNNISFYNYYKDSYNIDIKDKNQPLLISRVERRKDFRQGLPSEVRLVCLIPELCYITGLTDAMRADFRIMKDLTQKLQLTPPQRYEGLCKFLENIRNNKSASELLMKWGLRVAKYPLKLEARVVEQEKILYQDNQIILPPGNSNWVVNNQLLVPKDIQSWAVLHVAPDAKVAHDFESSMRRVCAQMGMNVYGAKFVTVHDNRNEAFLDALRSTIVPQLQLVVIFFPSLRSDRYAAVKKVCCIERPVSSQVIQSRTLNRPGKAQSIIKKIAMQINCKLGGALWGVVIPFKRLMVCGLDVYHGPIGRNISVMAFVAASDPQQTTWYSRVGYGANNEELSDHLRVCIGGALKKYCEVNGFYPDRIVLFRDGVGDGQLRMTMDFEVPQLIQSFRDMGGNYKPKLTVVVCQKRIMARMMAVCGASGRDLRVQNPPPGCVMDHTITRFEWYDFFLVSQSSNRGTVSPTHYIVVYDDSDIEADHIQRLTYKMTHLYYNWTGTISIPAPAQYAHRLAQLVGQHLHKNPSVELSDKLYFL